MALQSAFEFQWNSKLFGVALPAFLVMAALTARLGNEDTTIVALFVSVLVSRTMTPAGPFCRLMSHE